VATRISGNWRYYSKGQYIYCWTTDRQYHANNKYVSFVRRMHKTKGAYVTVDSKTATHATRVKAKLRAQKLAGMNVEVKKSAPKEKMPSDHGYCMKCKGSRFIANSEKVEKHTKQGTRYALVGSCEDCGTSICKFVADTRHCNNCNTTKKESDFMINDYVCRACRW